MVRRLVNVVLASAALVGLSPLLAAAAVGIRVASPGPVLFRARRVGKGGREFTMYKFRTMHPAGGYHSAITARNDPRIFPFGQWLRKLKIDELPQLVNVLRGEMAIVGPRPEDPDIVRKYYRPEHMETLAVAPGLTSPGSIHYYAEGERLLDRSNSEAAYAERLLPVKLALDLIYVREQSLLYDLSLIWRTISTLVRIALGQRHFAEPPEMKRASAFLAAGTAVCLA